MFTLPQTLHASGDIRTRLQLRSLVLAAAVAIVVAVPAGCSQEAAWPAVLRAIEVSYPDVPRVTTDSLSSWMSTESVPQPLLLDVRTPEEFEVSHLMGAIRIDSDADDVALIDTLSRSAPIVTYCSVGYRSSEMASKLQAAGFTNVANLEGSIFRWANEGRPVYRGGREVREVHPFDAAWGRLLNADLRMPR